VAVRPSATLAELHAWLAAAHGAVVGHAAMWRTLDRLDLTRNVWPAPSASGLCDLA
jgi:hypothetical protein